MEKFANQHLYTDVEPFEVIRVISDKTIEIRKMKYRELDWGVDFVAGGFFGHVTNQDRQRWLITSDETQPVVKARFNKPKGHKHGFWKSKYGRHFLSDQPIKFYDYNF